MKFAIAAAILAQKIPDIASEEIPPSILGQRALVQQQATTLVKPLKTFEGAQGLLLKNIPGINALKTCDPLSDDSDMGVLSCDLGYECVEDEASMLGGFCFLQTSRELEEPTVYCALCDYGKAVNGDIAGFQTVTLPTTGEEVTCLDIGYFAYTELLFTATTCPVMSSLAISAGCCLPYECPNICGDKEFLPFNKISTGDSSGFCFRVVANIDVTDCHILDDVVIPYCCEQDEGSVPTATSPPGVAPAPLPASDAVWMWSLGSALSMTGLAVMVTAAVMSIT
jgi:hypothetical protein